MATTNQRWEISDLDRRDSVMCAMDLIRREEWTAEDIEIAKIKIAAIGKLKELEAQNQKDERDSDPSKRLAGLLEIAQQLGTFRAAPETIEGRATSRPDESD